MRLDRAHTAERGAVSPASGRPTMRAVVQDSYGSAEVLHLVRSVGADHLIDYAREHLARGAHRYDVVLDLGGTRTLTQLRRVLTPSGTLVLVGGEGGGRWVGGAMIRSLRALALSPFVRQHLRMILATTTTKDLELLAPAHRGRRGHARHRPDLPGGQGAGRAPPPQRRRGHGQARHHRLSRHTASAPAHPAPARQGHQEAEM